MQVPLASDMTDRQTPTRHRLIQAAIELFITQGVAETTTRQIADRAEVNEVTLFRHFGNKYGLLLAVMHDAEALSRLGMALGQQANQMGSVSLALKDYASVHLQALEQIQEFVRSLIGEAGHYPIENRQALGRGLTQANRYTAQYLATVMRHEQLQTRMPTEKLASLLNSLLLGYAVLEFTSEYNELWQNRDSFIDGLVELFLYGALAQPDSALVPTVAQASLMAAEETDAALVDEARSDAALAASLVNRVQDLSTASVHQILKRAKKLGAQDYAIAYVLFGAGLNVEELAQLQRADSLSSADQHLLQVSGDPRSVQASQRPRLVPLNRWILGRRYGTSTNNPLTQWLHSRKDAQPAVFLSPAGTPMSAAELRQRWQWLVEGVLIPPGFPAQAHHTWCVEMLMRGMSQDNLSILTGSSAVELQPYIQRAQEKAALEQAIHLDQKSAGRVLPPPSALTPLRVTDP